MSIANAVVDHLQAEDIILVIEDDTEDRTDVGGSPPPYESVGALPTAIIADQVTNERSVLCVGCARPPGKVIATGATSDYQMGVRYAVDQLRKFLSCHMEPVEARLIAARFAEIVVDD
jgi:hypothetical protein